MSLPLIALLFPLLDPKPTPVHPPLATVTSILDDTEEPEAAALNTVQTITLTINGKSYDDPDLARSAMRCFNHIATTEGNTIHVNYTFTVSSIQIRKDDTVTITASVDNPTHTATFASGTRCQLIECDLERRAQALLGTQYCTASTGNTVTFPAIPTNHDPTRFFFVQASSTVIDQEEGGSGNPVGAIVDEDPEHTPPVLYPDNPAPRSVTPSPQKGSSKTKKRYPFR